jgi:hypothetical protein
MKKMITKITLPSIEEDSAGGASIGLRKKEFRPEAG